jgi:hypothetical protein
MTIYNVNGQDYELPDDMPQEEAWTLIHDHLRSTEAHNTDPKPQAANNGETIYEVNGQRYALPSNMSEEEAWSLIQADQEQKSSHASNGSRTSIDPESLVHNRDWLSASRILWNMNSNEDFQGDDNDLAEYGLDQMGWFNYNLPKMAIDTARISQATQEQKRAFLHLMNTYDDLEMSWGGTLRFGKGVLADPTTYVGLTTLGIGTAAGSATKLASKEALKSMLKAGIVTGIEGAALNAAANSMEQKVRIEGGQRSEMSMGELAQSGAFGFGAGAVLGGAVDAVGTVLRKARVDSVQPVTRSDGPTLPDKGETPSTSATHTADEGIQVDPAVKPGEAPELVRDDSVIPATSTDEVHPSHASAGEEQSSAILTEAQPKLNPSETPAATLQEAKVANPVLQAVREFAEDSGLRVFPRSGEELNSKSARAIDELLKLTPDNVARITEEVRRADTTGEQTRLLKNAFAQANEKMHREVIDLRAELHASSDPAEKAEIAGKVNKLLELQQTIRETDLAESSLSGYDLGSRRGLIDAGDFRNLSVDAVLERQGVNPKFATPEQRQKATDTYLEVLAKRVDALDTAEEVLSLEEKIRSAPSTSEALRLSKEREVLKERLAQSDPDTASAYQMGNRVLKYLNEYLISTVFTTKTLIVNLIPSAAKMAYRPALDYVVKGADAKAFREMTATYSAFASNMGAALRAAQFAFKVERGLLNGFNADLNKVLEEQTMFKGTFGRYLRFFPRVLGATDELFGQLNYRAYVVSHATGEAYEAATRQGLKGAEREAFIQQHVNEVVEQSFSESDTNSVIDFLRQTGSHNYGLSGAKLDAFIKTELDNNPDLFRQATNQAGRDFANDLAFKREFSGEGVVSQTASAYERFVNANPWMRLMGQLFFRTPVRVFEEGFRLTAGLNLITPHFLRDLSGKGPGGPGGFAQVRAQGEALLSFGIATAVMSLYAQGMITGGGPKDWRQKRDVEASKWNAYSIRFKDGSEFSFRNLDPFATPLKIITNALDAYSLLQVRKAQGEYVDQEEKQALAYVSAGALAVVQALKDASLTEGIDQLVELVENLTDPENKEDQLMRFLGQKAQLFVPNQWQKAQQALNDPALSNPATLGQHVLARINPSDPKVPKRYDALGFELKSGNPIATVTGIDYSTKADREKGINPKRQRVLDELANLTVLTGKTFVAPYQASSFAASSYGMGEGMNFDLRTQYVSDGSETYYDRLQRYVSQTPLVTELDRLLSIAKDRSIPVGTPAEHGEDTLTGMVSEMIQLYREAAWHKLIQQEQELLMKNRRAEQGRFNVLGGRREVEFNPFK